MPRPRWLRCRRTDARKRREWRLAAPHNSSSNLIVRADPSAVGMACPQEPGPVLFSRPHDAVAGRVDDGRIPPDNRGLRSDRLSPSQVGFSVEHLVGEPSCEDGVVGVGATGPITGRPEVEVAGIGRHEEVKLSIIGPGLARPSVLAADAQRTHTVVVIRPGEGHGGPGARQGEPAASRAHRDPQSDVAALALAADRPAIELDLPDRPGASPARHDERPGDHPIAAPEIDRGRPFSLDAAEFFQRREPARPRRVVSPALDEQAYGLHPSKVSLVVEDGRQVDAVPGDDLLLIQ